MTIDKVVVSKTMSGHDEIECSGDYTDVIVVTDSGVKYVAAFFTYKSIDTLRIQNKLNGEFLLGKYFWAPNMVLADSCTQEDVVKIVNHLFDEGNFKDVFRKI